MLNFVISKTDPYSFMGLIKALPTGTSLSSSWRSLINAGLVSLLLIVAISHMAQSAAGATQGEGGSLKISAHSSATRSCSFEACHMV